jgi:hypothetical protein
MPSASSSARDVHSGGHSIWPLLLLLAFVYLSSVLYTLPLNRVVELCLCQEYYERFDPSRIQRDGTIPEKLCKIDEVQQQLAWLQGIMETTLIICGKFVSVTKKIPVSTLYLRFD